MAIKTYRALQRGQAPNGAIVDEGEVFSAEFRELVYEGEDKKRAIVFEDGKAKTKVASKDPSWVEEVKPEAKAKDDKKG